MCTNLYLVKLRINGRGQTNCRNAIHFVMSSLNNDDTRPVQMFVISDGEINDTEECQKIISTYTNARKWPVHALLIRLKDHQDSSPSTLALSCFGVLSTNNITIQDVCVHNGNAYNYAELYNAIGDFCNKVKLLDYTLLSHETARFKRTPVSASMTECVVTTGTSVFCTEPIMPVIDNVLKEEELTTILTFLEERTALLQISNDAKKIEELTQWFNQLSEYLNKQETNSLLEGHLNTVFARTRAFSRRVHTSKTSILHRIRTNINDTKVATLNSQQQAEWLREISCNKSGKALARRTKLITPEGPQYAVEKLLNDVTIVESTPNEERSYFSLSNASDTILALQSISSSVKDFENYEILQVTGLVGVPFQAPKYNYIDPFNLRIDHVVCGTYLGEFDAEFTYGSACPGQSNITISGIIPLLRINPELYKLYTKKTIRTLFETQASISIRGAIAPITHDAVALCSAGAMSILASSKTLSTIQKWTLEALIENVRYLVGEDETSRVYNPEEYEALTTTIVKGIAPLKYVTALLRKNNLEKGLSAHIFNLYRNDCFATIKRVIKGNADESKQALYKLLNIDVITHGTKPQAEFVEEPASISFCKNYIPGEIPLFVPTPNAYEGLASYIEGEEITAADNIRLHSTIRAYKIMSGMPDEDASIEDTVQQIYKSEYEALLQIKKASETFLEMCQLVRRLADETNWELFKELVITKIVNRNAAAYSRLLETCFENNVPLQHQKLAFLVTGRDVMGDVNDALFVNGNIDYKAFKRVQNFVDVKCGEILQYIFTTFKVLYRADIPNRHGHGNSFPSFRQMGFRTMTTFKESVSKEEYDCYYHAHCIEKKCCLDVTK